jgi:L-threonine synthase (EC 4.2.3.1)
MTGILQKYRDFLPVTEKTPMITLSEGGTPLLRAERLSRLLEIDLYFKVEGMNPTGSFKDRGMAVAVAKALEAGMPAILCASTGNTSASAAAYAARAGIPCHVLIPEGKIAAGKLAQAVMYGARILSIEGNFDQALTIVRKIAEKHPASLVNSVNPHRLEGQKTAAFEIVDVLGEAPDILAIPVGNAGNISAYWMGFTEYKNRGKATRIPRMFGYQASGAAPLVEGRPIEQPETIATAIRIGRPAGWQRAVQAVSQSGGGFLAVTDEEILEAQKKLACYEGIFAEPASCAPLAGVIRDRKSGRISPGLRVVCVLTGNGLKDPDIVRNHSQPITRVPARYEAVASLLDDLV